MSLFTPRVSIRTPSTSYFAEIFQAPGPETIGDTKRGRHEDLFGWDWLAVIDREGILKAYQRDDEHEDGWVEVHDNLPPIFGTVLPSTARRMSFAFDQSARVIVALEIDQVVQVTRWDSEENRYVQNVSFAGVNPVLTMDALARVPISESDVVLFYQPPDAQDQINYRLQRELYNIGHTVYLHDSPVTLDRAEFIGPQLQLLVSDAEGNPLRVDGGLGAVKSTLYPVYPQDTARFTVRPEPVLMEQTTYSAALTDPVRLRVGMINPDGLSGEPVQSATPASPATHGAGVDCFATNEPNEEMQGWELLEGRLAACRLGVTSKDYPTCSGVGAGIRMPEWGAGTTGGYHLTDRNANFDAVVMQENLFGERYGVRAISMSFRAQWTIPFTGPAPTLDPVVFYRKHPDPEVRACVVESVWQAGPRTIVVEVAQSRTPEAAGAYEWHEVWRTTEEPPQVGLSEIREYDFYSDISLISDAGYPHVLVRIRTLPLSGSSRNSTHTFLLGGLHAQLHASTIAYVSSVYQTQLTDAARFAVRPVNLDLVSSVVRQQPTDPARFTATPIPTLDLVYRTAIESAADCARFAVAPINLEMRRAS